jgi:3-methylcrotonyl-CoA carboxylase alpha subunit
MERNYRHGDQHVRVSGTRQGNLLRLATEAGEAEFTWEELGPGDYLLRRDGKQLRCVVARSGEERWVWIDGHVHHLFVVSGKSHPTPQASPDDLVAPMPGQVLKVLVRAGESVSRNQPLLVLEAMKMQYEIVAPRDGVVARVCAPEGAQVAGGATLVALDEDGAS